MFRALNNFLLGLFVVGGVLGLFLVLPLWLAVYHLKLLFYIVGIGISFGLCAWLHDLGEEIRSTW